MNLLAIPPHLPFLDTLARAWLAQSGEAAEAVARGRILLPTRRAARALAEAFLRVSGGRPLLLPQITALGALDEAPLALAGALDLPPAVAPARRLAALSRLVLALRGAAGAPQTADRAWLLAGELARLMDEAEREGVDLATALPHAADPDHAAHWAQTLDFLTIVTRAWPDWLATEGVMNPAARQVALLDAQARAWSADPPDEPVWIAGTTGGIPAVARLLRVVAAMPGGCVILPGLDPSIDEAGELPLSHPQAGLGALLGGLGARVGDVAFPFGPPRGRMVALARALLPAGALAAWREPVPLDIAGLSRLEPADEQEEATAIALILRAALERPGARAALVTPDRALAGRVGAALLRFGVIADDSAGESLAETPPAVFLRLLAGAVDAELAPVALLSLLKHPLFAAGLPPAAARAAARALERAALRGPRPPPGLTGLREALAGLDDPAGLLALLERGLAPLLRATASVRESPALLLGALIEAGEALATTEAEAGAARLWAFEEGEALAALLADTLAALPALPEQPPAVLPGLLDAVLEGARVRSRRALRGREASEHPRVFIWGLLEARLQSAEVIVLGGLVEGVWPPLSDPGPWLSRPMRARIGLPDPEAMVGQSAHDFVMAACAAPEVVLSAPRRRDHAPAVPARWLVRLQALLAAQGRAQGGAQEAALPSHPAVGWARALDRPAQDRVRPVAPPRPCPPIALRPRRLSVTEIETWQRDPYAIYARHILRLRQLDPLEQATDAADYGSLVHAGLHRFLAGARERWPEDAAAALRLGLMQALGLARLRPALAAWWAPRLARIADWVATTEAARRAAEAPETIAPEIAGVWPLDVPGGFTLTGRADRIERYVDASLAILDYKTGKPPSQADVQSGLAPQLPLEAAMAAAGAFGPALRGPARALLYWQLSGGFEPGRALLIAAPQALVAATEAGLRRLITQYDDPATCYLAQPVPEIAPRHGVYAQLARVAEWGGG